MIDIYTPILWKVDRIKSRKLLYERAIDHESMTLDTAKDYIALLIERIEQANREEKA